MAGMHCHLLTQNKHGSRGHTAVVLERIIGLGLSSVGREKSKARDKGVGVKG